MALSRDEANSVSKAYFDETMRQLVYQDCAFYVKLKSKNRVSADGGENIQWPLRIDTLSKAQAVGPRQAFIPSQKETRTTAKLDWTYYFVDTMISWDERVKNTGKSQIVNLLKDKAQELKEDMDDRFATDLFVTNPNGLGFSSLAAIIDTASTYADVAVADAADWAAAVEDATTTELTLYGASGSLGTSKQAATFGKDGPDFYLTTPNLRNKFVSLLEPQKVYQDKEMANAGFSNVTFEGDPIVADKYCPTAAFFGICTNVFELIYHKDFDFVVTDWKSLEQYPNALVKYISWAGNLKCNNRKPNFKYTALDYTL
jgi:hypothetical protein